MVDNCFLICSTNFGRIRLVVDPFKAYTKEIKNIDKLWI